MTRRTVFERLMSRVHFAPSGCWEWTGARMPSGYGRIGWGSLTDGTRETALAHRVSYTILRGPIPDGLQIDHLCRNRSCVRPDHLEPVTSATNNRRARAVATECPQGHPYAGENLYVDPRGNRQCKACRRKKAATWQYWNKGAGRRLLEQAHLQSGTSSPVVDTQSRIGEASRPTGGCRGPNSDPLGSSASSQQVVAS